MAVFLEIWGLQAKGLVERGITHINDSGHSILKENETSDFFPYGENDRLGISNADISAGGCYVEKTESGQALANDLIGLSPRCTGTMYGCGGGFAYEVTAAEILGPDAVEALPG